MPKIDIIAGARPNFMKIAPIISSLQKSKFSKQLDYRLIHTGQHYDQKMSGEFFDQLNIPKPHINLEVGSGTQAQQTGAIMIKYEKILSSSITDLCLVVGDVTSTMACAITAKKSNILVAHVEAGIRSYDWMMPEEINRVVTDSVSDLFFTTSEESSDNLRSCGINDNKIFFVGNTMIDTLINNLNKLRAPVFWDEYSLEKNNYLVLTLHRPSNVDDKNNLLRTLKLISSMRRNHKIIFPVHPRTSDMLYEIDNEIDGITFVDPMGYWEFNYLVKNSLAVITDSGGITEETTFMGIPCLTLRNSTERPETVTVGTNELIGTDAANLQPFIDKLFAGKWKSGGVPEKWDGKTGSRIVRILENCLLN